MLDMAFNEINPYREKRLVGAAYQMTHDSAYMETDAMDMPAKFRHDILQDSPVDSIGKRQRQLDAPAINEAVTAFNEINQ